jgi:hypothetical protein
MQSKYWIKKRMATHQTLPSEKKLMSQDLRLPPAALSASGSRVEGLPSSQPVPQAPLLCNFFHYKAKQRLCQIKNFFTKLSKNFLS